MNNHFVMSNNNKTELLRQNNTTFSFIINKRVVTVVASNPIQAEMALTNELKGNK